MAFAEILEQVLEMLQRRGRVSYRVCKRQFDLDEAYLADLKAEIVEIHRLAVDQDGTMLVWTGGVATAPVTDQARGPVSAAALAEALAMTNDTGERRWESELHRLKRELLLAISAGQHGEAEICFHQALAIARRQ